MNRDLNLQRLTQAEGPWDLIIIGGGASGLGTAVDGAARGYRTLLLERADFAKGTSSRSTKLIHGGVRYLRQGKVGLVRESLQERERLLRNAPHLVSHLPFVVPIYRYWEGGLYWSGLKIYDRLASDNGLGRSRWLSRKRTMEHLPTLDSTGLRGGVLYRDAQFDDSRLAVCLARTLDDLGGVALNYFEVRGLLKRGNRVSGVEAVDRESGLSHPIRGRSVINAAGVFADSIRRMDEPDAERMIVPSQGVHLVLPARFLPGGTALMVPRTDDGRVLFAIPWCGRVVVGTTDTEVERPLEEPRALESETNFLIRHAGRYLRPAPSGEEVLAVFAGLRPLVKSGRGEPTSALGRDHQVVVSRSGLLSILGGKWTTYRRMAEDAVSEAARAAGLEERPSATADLKLHGWAAESGGGTLAAYGADSEMVASLEKENPNWARPLHPDLPYTGKEVVWAVRHEMARTIEDVLARRTRALILDARASVECAAQVAILMAAELDRDQAWRDSQVASFRALSERYRLHRPKR